MQQNYFFSDVDIDSELANLWKEPELKTFLIQRIQEKKKKGVISQSKKINENLLLEEYWRNWMEIDSKDYLKKIYNHPALTSKDLDDLNEIISKYRQKQMYWGIGCTCFTLGIYSAFLKKNKVFYNFFRKKSKIRYWPFIKKGVCVFGVFWVWIVSLNFLFDKHIPSKVHEKNLFTKYSITYDP